MLATAAPRRTGSVVAPAGLALLVILLVVTVVVLAWTISFPGVPSRWAGWSLLCCAACVVLSTVVVRLDPNRVQVARVVAVMACTALLGCLLVGTAATRTWRFEASRTALEQVVAGHDPLSAADFPLQSWSDPYAPEQPPTVEQSTFVPFTGACPARIGAYDIAECRSFEGGFLFLQTQNAVTDDSGIAWLPGGPRPVRADGSGLWPSEFTHLDGPWYRWTCGC